jgi:thiamine transport system permease protein
VAGRVDADRAALADPPHNRLPLAAVAALAAVPAAAVTAFVATPLITLLVRTARPSSITDVVRLPGIGAVWWFSAWQAALSTLAALLAGIGPALLLARYRFAGRRLLMALTTIPFMLPTVVSGAALRALLPDAWQPSWGAMIIGHAYVNVAVVVRLVGPAWADISTDLVGAARTLGAGPWQTRRLIVLPLLRPALTTSATLVFFFSFTSFGLASVLGGPRHPTVETEIARRAVQLGDVDGAAVLAVAQLVVLLVLGLAIGQRSADVRLGAVQPGQSVTDLPPSFGARLAVGAVGVLIAAPLAAMVVASLRIDGGLSLAGWRGAAGSRVGPAPAASTWTSLSRSLGYAAAAAAMATVIGASAAFAGSLLRRSGASAAASVLSVVTLVPLATSAVSVGLGLLITFDTRPFDWRGSWPMIPLGHAMIAAPLVARAVAVSLRANGGRAHLAAAALGASPLRAWWHGDVRATLPTVAASAGLAAAISLGDFGTSSVLSRSGAPTAPMAVAQLLSRPAAVSRAQGFALATMLAVVTALAVVAADRKGLLDARRP